MPTAQAKDACSPPAFLWKLWLYTNYDCNLRCSYCVAKSSPNAPRRALGIANRGYVMESGEITMTGEARTMLNDPKVRAAYLGE